MKSFLAWILCFVFFQPTDYPAPPQGAPPLASEVRAVVFPEKRELRVTRQEAVDTILLMIRRLPFKGTGFQSPPPFTRGCDLRISLSDGTNIQYTIRGVYLKPPGKNWEKTDKVALGLLYFLLEYYSAQNASLHSKHPGRVLS